MKRIPVLRVVRASSVHSKLFRVSVLCAWILYTPFISTVTITHRWSTNHTDITSTAGPLNITDFCPGVQHFLHQQRTDTFLQVNVSDCEHHGLKPTAKPGVVFGVCGDLSTFCILCIKMPPSMRVHALVQRLEYWCGSRRWTTAIRTARSKYDNVYLSCNRHSLKEVYVAVGRARFIENINSPSVNIVIEIIKNYNFVVKRTMENSGYIMTPLVIERNLDFIAEWKMSSRRVIMVSVQEANSNNSCNFNLVGLDHSHKLIKLTFSNTSEPPRNFHTLNVVCNKAVTVLQTSHLTVEFSEHYIAYHRFLRLYVSVLSARHQHIKLANGLINCSVSDYSAVQPHLDCNLQQQCEDGRDETEHCAYSSPHCQGLVASRYKCFQLIFQNVGTHVKLFQYQCQELGGRLASIKTRKVQADFLQLFESYFEFKVTIGCVAGGNFGPFSYSLFRKWFDNTMIYNVDHFIVDERYLPSWHSAYISVESMVLKSKERKFLSAICEVRLQPQTFLVAHVSLARLHSSQSALIYTQQSLIVCHNGDITHQFLSCDSSCMKRVPLKNCAIMNMSDVHHTHNSVPERFEPSDTMFRCDDDTTTVHFTFVCDFRQDCPDGSDEWFCEHPSCSGFLCINGQCALSSQQCNQCSDCLDDSDEYGCRNNYGHLTWFKDEDRKQWVYLNLDGAGYFTQQVMSADQSCPDSHYQCKEESLYCLPVYTRCNGFSDCVHGEDEQGCDTVMCPGFYQCRSSPVCVHGDHLCDGWGQCPQRDDELMCDFTCPEGCLCQGHVFSCHQLFPSDLYPQLRYVDATGSNMSLAHFNKNIYLVHLKLSQCSLYNISYTKLLNLRHIDLANNYLTTVNLTTIINVPHLLTLRLENNPLSKIWGEQTHHIHYSMRNLDVSRTDLNILHSGVSLYLHRGKFLNTSSCGINVVGQLGLKSIPQLKELDITGNPITSFPLDLLLGLDHIERIFTTNFRLCCRNLLSKSSSKINCFTADVVLPSCSVLLPTEVYLVFFWLVSTIALVGNILCIIISSAVAKVFGHHFVKLAAHLQAANICLGSHVSIIVIANYAFYGTYIQFEKAWTNSVICKLAGFLSFLASMVSVLIIWFITMHHVLTFCFPDQLWRFSKHLTAAACISMWVIGFMMAVVPFLPGLSHWGLQGQSGLCRLALFDGDPSGQHFRWFTVTVVVNGIWSVMIVAGQAVIYRRTPKYRRALSPTQRSAFSSVHVNRNLAVTDAVCWIAFVLVFMMRSYHVTVFNQIHDTMVVFVLPFNSALNPLLYLWTAKTQRQGQQLEDKVIEMLKFRIAQAGKRLCSK